MTEASDLAKYASKANAVFNSVTANSTAITSMSVGGHTINATSFAGTANNATNLGGVAAASYQLNSTLAANVATLAANSSSYANASVTNTFTVGTSAYFVSNGNVGIGTNSPTYDLTVNGGTLGTSLNDTVNAFQVYALSNNADYLNFYKIRQTAANSSWETAAWRIQQVVDTTSQGYIQFNGSSATDTISFGTGNTERMRIGSSGNVGIGTSSPATKLDVRGVIQATDGTSGTQIGSTGFLEITNAGGAPLIDFKSSGAEDYDTRIMQVSDGLTFATGGNGAASERMRIDASGNVGIGNTAPAHKLRVQGDISVSGGIHANGSLGTAGQVLTSNGTVAYWTTAAGSGTVTSVATGSGLTGGTITTTGTLSVLANTGIVANATGLYVNSAYIATLAANSSSYANASVTNTFTVGTSAYFVSNGNVGIGTSSPAYPLTISRAGATDSYAQWTNGGGGNFIIGTVSNGTALLYNAANTAMVFNTNSIERMRIDASGNVGIGTSSPAYKLDVYSASGDSTIASRSAASGAGIFRAVGSNTTFAAYNALISTEFSGTQQWYLGGDGVANTIIIKTGTTERMRIAANGNVTVGSNVGNTLLYFDLSNINAGPSAGSIARLISANVAGTGTTSVDIVKYKNGSFYINNNESNTAAFTAFGVGASERMRITSSGSVGIGETSPTVRLEVNSGSTDEIARFGGSSVVNPYVSLYRQGTRMGYWYAPGGTYTELAAEGRPLFLSTTAAHEMRFLTNSVERMRIDSSGNVGIGNTAPTQKLHVQGTALATSDFRAPIFYDSDDTNSYFEGPQLFMRGSAPTMYFRDTDSLSAMIHVNSNIFYVLRGATDSTTWTTVGGVWPLEINLTNNNAQFGNTVTAIGDMRAPIFYDSNDTTYYANPAGGSQFKDHTRFGPYAGSNGGGGAGTHNITNVEIMNNGGSGDNNCAAISFHCQAAYGMHMHLRPDAYFGIGGWSAAAWRWYVYLGNGDMTAAGNVVAYSDPRLKEDIQKIESPVDKLKKLNGVRFRWKDNSILGHPGEYDYGVLANEVQEVFPEIVADTAHESPDGDKYKAVAYDKLVPVLIEAVKTQQNEIDELKSLVKTLMENR